MGYPVDGSCQCGQVTHRTQARHHHHFVACPPFRWPLIATLSNSRKRKNMHMKASIGIILGGISVFLSIVVFLVASAPFAPAIVLLYITIPLAAIAALLSACRLALLTVYFSMIAWFSSPSSGFSIKNVEYFLLYSGVFGAVLAGVWFAQWRHRANIT